MKTEAQHEQEKAYYRNRVFFLLGVLEGAAAGSSDERLKRLGDIAGGTEADVRSAEVTFEGKRL